MRTLIILLVLAAAGTDIRYGRIPNTLTGAGLALWLFFPGRTAALPDLILLPLVLYPAYRAGGLGAGDIKLFWVISLYIGWRGALQVLAIAFYAGAVMAAAACVRRGRRGGAVRFAPCIAVGLAAYLAGARVF